jgi:hypothetical protein
VPVAVGAPQPEPGAGQAGPGQAGPGSDTASAGPAEPATGPEDQA